MHHESFLNHPCTGRRKKPISFCSYSNILLSCACFSSCCVGLLWFFEEPSSKLFNVFNEIEQGWNKCKLIYMGAPCMPLLSANLHTLASFKTAKTNQSPAFSGEQLVRAALLRANTGPSRCFSILLPAREGLARGRWSCRPSPPRCKRLSQARGLSPGHILHRCTGSLHRANAELWLMCWPSV